MFQDETDKVTLKIQSNSSASSSSPRSQRTRSRSLERPRTTPGITIAEPFLTTRSPWLKSSPAQNLLSTEDQAVASFMDKFVMYPCTSSSTPGFLEHLPCLFKEVNVAGRYALRYAVQAASFADLSKNDISGEMAKRALESYGLAFRGLGKSL